MPLRPPSPGSETWGPWPAVVNDRLDFDPFDNCGGYLVFEQEAPNTMHPRSALTRPTRKNAAWFAWSLVGGKAAAGRQGPWDARETVKRSLDWIVISYAYARRVRCVTLRRVISFATLGAVCLRCARAVVMIVRAQERFVPYALEARDRK